MFTVVSLALSRARRLCGSINISLMNEQVSSGHGEGEPAKSQMPGTQSWAFSAGVEAFHEREKTWSPAARRQGLCHN